MTEYPYFSETEKHTACGEEKFLESSPKNQKFTCKTSMRVEDTFSSLLKRLSLEEIRKVRNEVAKCKNVDCRYVLLKEINERIFDLELREETTKAITFIKTMIEES